MIHEIALAKALWVNTLGYCCWDGTDFSEWNLAMYVSVTLKEIVHTVVVITCPGSYLSQGMIEVQHKD